MCNNMFWVWMPRTVPTALQPPYKIAAVMFLVYIAHFLCIAFFSLCSSKSHFYLEKATSIRNHEREKTPIRYVWINEIWKRIYLLWSLNGLNRIINRFMTFIFDAMQHRFPFDFGFILRSLSHVFPNFHHNFGYILWTVILSSWNRWPFDSEWPNNKLYHNKR